jgi:peptidoglycan/xylan/chitin deacetylase (PgdA/CDA1 family)
MGRSYEQRPIRKDRSTKEGDQAAMIERSLSILERFTRTSPIGWLGPGLAQTPWTPDLLAAAGIRYIGDWVYDDEPTTIHTANGELMALPDTLELNDIAMMIESGYLLQRAIDQFDRLYQEGKERAKIMALAVHPYISGQPHRIKISKRSTTTWRGLTAFCTGTARKS